MVRVHITLLNKIIMENIDFVFFEYTNFLNEKYKVFGNDWVRISDDKIIYNIAEILEDFFSQTSPSFFSSQSSNSFPSSLLNLNSCENSFCMTPFLYPSKRLFFFLRVCSFSSTAVRKVAILDCSGRVGRFNLICSIVLFDKLGTPPASLYCFQFTL